MYEPFEAVFGRAERGTGVQPALLGLASHPDLEAFASELGGGVFDDGFVSVLSDRERTDDLGGWERWLPDGSVLFACTAFGFLYTLAGSTVWVTDTQYGEVMEADLSVSEAINNIAEPATRDEILNRPVFRRWAGANGALPSSSVLNPTPMLALGGALSVESLSVVPLQVYLSITSQLFEGDGPNAVNVVRLGAP